MGLLLTLDRLWEIWTDPYGNSLGVQLFNEQGQEVEQYGILPPGSYTVWIYLGDQSLSYEAVIREREAIALVPGEQTLKIAPGESGLYTLPYLDTEKTRISLGEGTYVTYQAGPREDPLRYTGGGSDIYVKQEQGETVYLLIRNESEMEEIPANLLTVRELRTQVAAVPDTAVYAWGDLFLDGILLEKTYGEGTPLREYFDRGYFRGRLFLSGGFLSERAECLLPGSAAGTLYLGAVAVLGKQPGGIFRYV